MSDIEPEPLDPKLEWKLRAAALPAALLLALAFNVSPIGHMLQRTFLSMIPHELGHAVTAWVCGFAALPGLWKTMVPEDRGLFVSTALAIGLAFIAWRGWATDRMWLVVLAVACGAAQFLATTTDVDTARTAITFGGDGGALVIGTGLMLTFFAAEGSQLRAGALRWGLLVIGAAAYVDVAMVWWRAKQDHDNIPFGEIERVGLSDPSKLLEDGWTPAQMVSRYLTVAGICLATLLAVWAWQTWAMRKRALEA